MDKLTKPDVTILSNLMLLDLNLEGLIDTGRQRRV
jgi:hypothetical protein